jgi:hypothetical protein
LNNARALIELINEGMARMARKDRPDEEPTAFDRFNHYYRTALGNLYHATEKANASSRYISDGFSVRRWHGNWLAVCKAWDSRELLRVVAFGSGSTPMLALASVNAAISAGNWKVDHFSVTNEMAKKIKPHSGRERDNGL